MNFEILDTGTLSESGIEEVKNVLSELEKAYKVVLANEEAAKNYLEALEVINGNIHRVKYKFHTNGLKISNQQDLKDPYEFWTPDYQSDYYFWMPSSVQC